MNPNGEPPDVPAGSVPPIPPKSTSGEAVAVVIPYRNPYALASYYIGIFSILPLIGLVMGIAAVILGVMGLRHAGKNPGAHGRVHAFVGIGCGGVCALIWAITAVSIAIMLFSGFSVE